MNDKKVTPLDLANMVGAKIVKSTGREIQPVDVSSVLPRIKELVTRVLTLRTRYNSSWGSKTMKGIESVIYKLSRASTPLDPMYETGTPSDYLTDAVGLLDKIECEFNELAPVKKGYSETNDYSRTSVDEGMKFYPFVAGLNPNSSSLVSEMMRHEA